MSVLNRRSGDGAMTEKTEAQPGPIVSGGQGVVIMANSQLSQMFFNEIDASVARAYAWPGYKIEEYVCEDNRYFEDPAQRYQRLKVN